MKAWPAWKQECRDSAGQRGMADSGAPACAQGSKRTRRGQSRATCSPRAISSEPVYGNSSLANFLKTLSEKGHEGEGAATQQ